MTLKRKKSSSPDLSNAEFGISVENLFELNILPDVELIAGKGGTNRVIRAVTVMEAPDFLDWVKKDELLLTTGFAIANKPTALHDIIPSLVEKGLAALGIKPGRFIDNVPDEMIHLADQFDFPLIKIPYNVSFSDLIMPISHAINERQARYLRLSEKMHDILMEAALEVDGLNYLGNKLYELVNNPISIQVPTLDLTVNVPDDIIVNDLASVSNKSQLVEAAGSISRIKRQAINWKGKRIKKTIFPIVAGAEKLGLIIVWELNPLSRLAIAALERSISIAAYEIMKSYALIAVESRYKNIVVDQLVTPDEHSFDNVKERAKIFGWNLKQPYCVFVIQLYNDMMDHTPFQKAGYLDQSLHLISRLICKVSHDLIVAEKGNRIIVIATEALIESEKACQKIVEEINGALKTSINKFSYRIGVGRIHRSEKGMSLSYEDACKALKVFEHMNNTSNIAYFEELGVWRLLSSIQDQQEVIAFINDTLGELIEYDKKYNTTFLKTLEIYLMFNSSIKQTAKYFDVHYNTITYRLDRIKRLFNIDLMDQHQRLSVELALKFIDNKI